MGWIFWYNLRPGLYLVFLFTTTCRYYTNFIKYKTPSKYNHKSFQKKSGKSTFVIHIPRARVKNSNITGNQPNEKGGNRDTFIAHTQGETLGTIIIWLSEQLWEFWIFIQNIGARLRLIWFQYKMFSSIFHVYTGYWRKSIAYSEIWVTYDLSWQNWTFKKLFLSLKKIKNIL